MAFFEATMIQLALTVVLAITFCFAMQDLDYIDGMKIVRFGSEVKREERTHLFRSAIHDLLSSPRARERRDAPTLGYPDAKDSGKLAHEFVLHGDNHSVAFLHWSGARSEVIFIFTADYREINRTNVGSIYAKSAYIWRSTNYGESFDRDDVTKFPKGSSISGIRFCKGNNKKVLVFDKAARQLYVSTNEGSSYESVKLLFRPADIRCHSIYDDMLLGYDDTTEKLYYSKDSGTHWTLLSAFVAKYYWVLPHLGNNPKIVFIEVKNNGRYHSSVLKFADLSSDSPDGVQVFDNSLGFFGSLSFEMQGNYLFVKKHYPSSALFVSYNLGKFQKAVFPLKLPETDYYVVDASEGEVLVSVKHLMTYNLYVSGTNGTKYSLSLQRLLATRTIQWNKIQTLADIHMVKSLRGVYLANIHFGHKRYFRTMITFDKGGTWYPLRVPQDSQSSCVLPKCSLNLHMQHSQHYYQIPGIVSSKTAVGLIIAQGELGTSFTLNPNVFMSRDGGLTWKRVLYGSYDFVLLDHGGIIAAVPLRNNTKTVQYSCSEGNTWASLELAQGLLAYGLVTEPGSTTLVSNIFGQHLNKRFEWLSVKLNFSSVFSQPCTDANYTQWSPVDERVSGNCSLGEMIVYTRRKASDCCFNGRDYNGSIIRGTCNCTDEDYMCDVGFKRDRDDNECYPEDLAVLVPDPCPETTYYMKSSGYRKVPGDRCSGGQLEQDFKPVWTRCPTLAPEGLQIIMERTTVASLTPISFKLVQNKGSISSTWYVWDFGDSNKTTNLTGLALAKNLTHEYKYHGDYNVTITAGNIMGSAYTKIIVRVIDVIRRAQIIPPHAVLVDRPADFNVTLFSNHALSWRSEHGFVHFVWRFEEGQKPNLTWESQVQHVFTTKGKYKVSLEAINEVSRQYDSVTITVHDKLRTLRLYFNEELDKENKGTVEWREYFARRLLAELTRILNVASQRLEVAVVQGLPTYVDVSIIERDENTTRTMDQLAEDIRQAVSRNVVEVSFPDGSVATAIYAEVLSYEDKKQSPTRRPETQDYRLAIAIGVAAGVVMLFLVGIIFFAYRRYTWMYRRYHRLSMNGSQPLNAETEPALDYSANGEGVRYTVTSVGPEPGDSDDELIRDTGELQVMEEPEDANDDVPLTSIAGASRA
ncbi:predicted protein [Nematostella vectensis]|uniref:PKD domain-containing protein n=1 Tax=Nematostella vectensis TaxID=45351 RepID=A7SK47_NEMVE|nr:VPS10 domain-containing receptor SorCS3 [Nematostella vectensis]EDO35926.1 predicted protein [Nematostella vectensis]|eukprot:XP_001627989.1 predicted protein [Nematostella vectensis]